MKLDRQKNLFPNTPRLTDAVFGDVCDTTTGVVIKLNPAKSLFQSTLIASVIKRGDCFVMHPEDGKLTILNGMIPVTILKATLKVEE